MPPPWLCCGLSRCVIKPRGKARGKPTGCSCWVSHAWGDCLTGLLTCRHCWQFWGGALLALSGLLLPRCKMMMGGSCCTSERHCCRCSLEDCLSLGRTIDNTTAMPLLRLLRLSRRSQLSWAWEPFTHSMNNIIIVARA